MATLNELVEARDGLAFIMSLCDDDEASLYVPIFERLEREITALEAQQDTLTRARQIALGRAERGQQRRLVERKRHAG